MVRFRADSANILLAQDGKLITILALAAVADLLSSRADWSWRMSRVRYSLPGDWVNRAGRPVRRPRIQRIVVLKPDHIGDLLIASPAFALLRRCFPSASVDLVCGPWNVEIARQLGLFHHVHGVGLFQELSDRQAEPTLAAGALRAGVSALADLSLGRYDLAIDLRYDGDSRAALLALDATVYAGFGSSREFPFLDIALPVNQDGRSERQESAITMLPAQFRAPGLAAGTWAAGDGGGRLSVNDALVQIALTIDGARSPVACGSPGDDRRELGIGLEAVELEPLDATGHPASATVRLREADIAPLSGWSERERWGIWTVGNRAQLAVRVPGELRSAPLNLNLFLRGHVNLANPKVTCTAEADHTVSAAVRMAYPLRSRCLTLTLPRRQGGATLVSPPFRLVPGDYAGLARLHLPRAIDPEMMLTVRIADGDTGMMVWSRSFRGGELKRGLCELPLRFTAELGPQPLTAVIEASDGAKFDGTTIESFTLRCQERRKPQMPAAHMEHWTSLLVLRVAQMFSTEPPFGADAALPVLRAAGFARAPTGATAEIVSRLRGWQRSRACVVALATGCNSAIRTWPLTYYLELARALHELGRVELVFVGGRADGDGAEQICSALGLDAEQHMLCGRISLNELGLVLEACDLFVGNNTGITHFAGRVGVRTIGIYAGTNHPKEWAPVGPNTSWIINDEDCAPCHLINLKDCRFGHACLRDLLPADVLEVVLPEVTAILDARAPGPGTRPLAAGLAGGQSEAVTALPDSCAPP